MDKKNDSWNIFTNAKKEVLIRAVKDPHNKDGYLLTFESSLPKKDAGNVLDICNAIFNKEKISADKKYAVIFEVKQNKNKIKL